MVGLPIFIAYFHGGDCHRQARGGHHEAPTFNLSYTVVYLDRNSGINTSQFLLRK
jgi:hypothetical protein